MGNSSDTNTHNEAGDGLLAGLERLAGELDRQQLSGRVWHGPPKARRRLPWVWWVGPVGAVAAGIVLSVMLLHRTNDPGEGARPLALGSMPVEPEPPLASVQTLRPAPMMLDAAVLAHLRLGVPDVTSPPSVPGMARSPYLDGCNWEIPDIRLPEL
jgi:hypothetical protein